MPTPGETTEFFPQWYATTNLLRQLLEAKRELEIHDLVSKNFDAINPSVAETLKQFFLPDEPQDEDSRKFFLVRGLQYTRRCLAVFESAETMIRMVQLGELDIPA
jgi:hypothetical protein